MIADRNCPWCVSTLTYGAPQGSKPLLPPLAGVFELTVLGKNGVTIDSVLYTPNSSPATLTSQVIRNPCHPWQTHKNVLRTSDISYSCRLVIFTFVLHIHGTLSCSADAVL